MRHKTFSRIELKTARSRLLKKRNVKQIYSVNFNFYLALIKYNLIRHFLKNQVIYLNYNTLVGLIREERTVTLTFRNWVILSFRKNY